MRIIECIQYSETWWQARRGIPTASAFGAVLTATGKPTKGKGRLSYIAELLADRVSLNPPFHTERSGHTAAMRNGIDSEPDARRWYAIDHAGVREVGFCLTDDGRFGCSPDGLIGDEGCLELKCPEPKTHMGYLLAGKLPGEYKAQVHGQLVVTGRPWADFLSYSPGLDPFLVRVEADLYTQALASALDDFWAEYDAASRKQLGEPAPGCAPDVFAATLAAFDKFLSDVENEEQLNAGLENLVGLIEPAKRAAWEQICQFARLRGWEFDREAKKFKRPVQPAF